MLATSNMTLFVVAFFPCNTPLLANHCRFENTKSVYVSHAFRIGTTHENNGDTVCGRNCADVVSTGDGSLDGSALVLVVDALSGEVCGTTLAHLEDDGRLGIAGSLEGCDDGGGGSHVDRGDGVSLGLCVLEEVVDLEYVNCLLEAKARINSRTSSP